MSTIPSHTSLSNTASNGSLGYGIAITAGILILISTILISSYACRWINRASHADPTNTTLSLPGVPSESNPCIIIKGLDMPTIESYPKFVYGRDEFTYLGPQDNVCSICLSEYKAEEMLRCVPECKHCFHAVCIDEWLQRRATCPMCRNSPLPTPVATPMSELIPLASNAR